jgi:hypothetical protein
MITTKIIIFLFYLLLILAIVFFNWLYSARALKANREIGLYTPQYIKLLVRISTGIAIGTAILIGIFLIAQIY